MSPPEGDSDAVLIAGLKKRLTQAAVAIANAHAAERISDQEFVSLVKFGIDVMEGIAPLGLDAPTLPLPIEKMLATPEVKEEMKQENGDRGVWVEAVRLFSRNDRSKARQIEVLRMLEDTATDVRKKEIIERLSTLILFESGDDSAIVTMLSRMARDKLLSGDGAGRYVKTTFGGEELKRLLKRYGYLAAPSSLR